jgi:hypothetical protein
MAFASTQIGTPYYMSPELFKNKVRLFLPCSTACIPVNVVAEYLFAVFARWMLVAHVCGPTAVQQQVGRVGVGLRLVRNGNAQVRTCCRTLHCTMLGYVCLRSIHESHTALSVACQTRV